jgi:hypothetical protein
MAPKNLQHLLLKLQVVTSLVTLVIAVHKLMPVLASACQSYLA